MEYYENQNDHSDSGANNLYSNYWTRINDCYYNSGIGKTVYLVENGWDGYTIEETVEVNGNYENDQFNGLTQSANYTSLCCPITGSGSFPTKK